VTTNPNADSGAHSEILEGLADLRRQVMSAPLEERIRHKFKIKNTTGYSLNALVDFEDPFEILKPI
jgi:D-lactate dehydrogenase